MSAESGCDGSDPNVLLCDDFEHKGATLEREFTTRRDVLAQEIAGLETHKQELDRAIEAIQSKFAKK